MEISIQTRGNVDIISVIGSVDAGDHLRLREGLSTAIELGQYQFVLDLRETAMLDSLAIGELVACLKRARETGGDVRLVVTPDGIVHNMLRLTRLDHIFQIYGNTEDARSSYVTGAH